MSIKSPKILQESTIFMCKEEEKSVETSHFSMKLLQSNMYE